MAIDIKAIQAKAAADKQAQEDQVAANAVVQQKVQDQAGQAVEQTAQVFSADTAVQRKAEPSALKAALERAAQQPESTAERVFYGEFQTHQNYLTPKGATVSFYRGYFATTKQELIDFCLTLDGVREVTGKIKASDIPVAPKRDRNRNWASAGPSDPTMISPAELLQRVVQNSSNMTTSARSDSSN